MDESQVKADEPRAYTPPEIMELGDAQDLTMGNAPGNSTDAGPVFHTTWILVC